MLKAVSQSGDALMHANVQFRNNKEVALAAVGQDGYALRFASIAMIHESEVIFHAVFNQPKAFIYAGEALKINVDFVNQLLGKMSVNATRLGQFIDCLKKMNTVYKKVLLQSVIAKLPSDALVSERLRHGNMCINWQILKHISGYLSLDDAPSFFKVFKQNEASRRRLDMHVNADQLNDVARLGS